MTGQRMCTPVFTAVGAMLALAFVLSALVPGGAHAAGRGDTILVSGPAGLGPLDPGLGLWNRSGRANLNHTFSSDDVTPDGRYAVFVSDADGLAGDQDTGVTHVLRKDRQTGALVVVDAGTNGSGNDPTISDDGRYVAFASLGATLATADTTRDADVFVKDLQTGGVTLITPAAASSNTCLECLHPVISGNGAVVAFQTADQLDPGDGGARSDVYSSPRAGGAYTLVSAKPGGILSSNGSSFAPSVTTDGTKVAFLSSATDLDPGDDPNDGTDVYVRLLAGTSASLASAQNGNSFGIGAGSVGDGQISGDGLRVVFSDTASYVAGDGDALSDVYRRTIASQVTQEMSVSSGGADADRSAFGAATDATGDRVAFISAATNLGSSTDGPDLFVRLAALATTTAITDVGKQVTAPAFTDGDAVIFASDAALAGDSPSGVFAGSVLGGAFTLVSTPSSGQALHPGLTDVRQPSFTQSERRLSTDGRYAVFVSSAPALGGPLDAEACWRRDLRTGRLDLVSTAGTGGAATSCLSPTISADGTRVAFVTYSKLDAADDGAPDSDVYLRDLAAGTTTFVSRAEGAAGVNSDGTVADAEISADGRRVGFISDATNLGAPGGGTGKFHAYVRDLAGSTNLIADRFAAGGALADVPLDVFTELSLNASGERVAFHTNAKLVAADTDTLPDVYVRDLTAGTTTLISVQSAAIGGAKGDLGSSKAVMSANGRRVVFASAAQNLEPALAPWPSGATFQIFRRDVDAQTTTMVSRSASGNAAGDAGVFNAAVDAGGDVVAIAVNPRAVTTNLTPEVTGGESFILVRNLAGGAAEVVHFPVVEPETGFPGVESPVLSEDGRCLGFFGRGRGLVPGLSPDFAQMFARPLQGDCGTVAPSAPAPAGGPAPAATATGSPAPRLTGVSLSRTRFRAGPKATALSAAARRLTPAGTTIRFTLSKVAGVAFRFTRSAAGRRAGKRCVAPARRLRKARRCTRTLVEGGLTRRSLGAGARRLAFSGRVGKRKLPVGVHVVTLVATDAGGLASQPAKLTFRVVRR